MDRFTYEGSTLVAVAGIPVIRSRCTGPSDQIDIEIPADDAEKMIQTLLSVLNLGDEIMFHDVTHSDECFMTVTKSTSAFTAMHGGHGHSSPESPLSESQALALLMSLRAENVGKNQMPILNFVHAQGRCPLRNVMGGKL